ncbi:thioredoxin-like protein [Choiromyces venosus 120613-1]|uniref:Thioredoxin-like protein n=1 Tax=Choiromyces venosus 120613-1 TaxID=1336337 RepID=A0A3N4JG39_9PEZI|nr:thioredoxin-like protein [Choiromyces venosus 120613-1]
MSITLYTSRLCPWCHRAHIALTELGLEYKEVAIDLAKPREPWYLEINPRGLVPTLKYNDEIILESGIVSTFLTDLKDNHLVPLPGTPDAALKRARINFFVDTYFSKAQPLVHSAITATDAATKTKHADDLVDVIEKQLAPLLSDAKPFFGGSSRLTLAEVLTASFVIRLYAYSKPGADLFPLEAVEKVKKIPNWQKWADALLVHDSVMGTFQEEDVIRGVKRKLAMRAAEAKK